MMPNVKRGDRMQGLLRYLVGPGRFNEHTDPHLVTAGDDMMVMWYDDAILDQANAGEIATHLDRPYDTFEADVNGGHVWHCSLSLRSEEGTLSDEKWASIARDFVAAMEFDDCEGTRAPCRWAAIHHGQSKGGNDHIHLVVDLVRNDGTKASVHNDFRRVQAASRALEVKHSLEQLESHSAGRATRGYKPGEREAQARRRAEAKYSKAVEGTDAPSWKQLTKRDRDRRINAEMRSDAARYRLGLRVRGAAEASASEDEFVRRLRRAGVLVRPRFAQGRTDVVEGYKVAEKPLYGETPTWYGGRHLARDLSIKRLRVERDWPDTPDAASASVAEWQAAWRGKRVAVPGRETHEVSPEVMAQQAEEIDVVMARLRDVPLHDQQTWATVARQCSGVLSAWSMATETEPGPLARAAQSLSVSAQTYRQTPSPQRLGTTALSGAAMSLTVAASHGQGRVAQAMMIRQMLRMTKAIHDASVSSKQVRQAENLATTARRSLVEVRDQLPNLKNLNASVEKEAGKEFRENLDPESRAMMERIEAGRSSRQQRGGGAVAEPMKPTAGSQARDEQSIER